MAVATGWQDAAVALIGLLLAAWLGWRLRCFFSGGRRGGCAACTEAHCPLKNLKTKK
ncbi:MAG: hypothetical protein K2G10_04430 [Alistipes sp.]|nr:hypothetical protein [Alistipes sp.]